MKVEIILYLLLIHWVGDFLFQTTWMATNKSKSGKALFAHTVTYSLTMMVGVAPLLNFSMFNVFLFTIITFAAHSLTDAVSSQFTATQFARKIYNGWNGGFTIVGFDQWIHYIQIFLTFQLLK